MRIADRIPRLTESNLCENMKILLIAPLPPPSSGIGSWTSNLLEYYSGNPGRFELIHQNTALKYRNILKNDFWNRWCIGVRESIRVICEAQRNIKTYSPDVIHLTSSASLALLKDFVILKMAGLKRIPLIIHWHFGRIPLLAKKNNWEWRLIHYLLRRIRSGIVIDPESYNTLIRYGFNNAVFVPNPVSLDVEKRISNNPGGEDQIRQCSLLFAGHIIREKGVYELTKACTGIHGKIELRLVGPYEQSVKAELEKIADEKDNGNWLKFTGTLTNDQVLDQMINSQILVLPSYTEGFPYVVVEAMSMGCAVIATGVGAIPEILAGGTKAPCGICVPVKNAEKLGEAIEYLLRSPQIILEMGGRGVSRILENYTLDKVVLQYESLWENVVINSETGFAG